MAVEDDAAIRRLLGAALKNSPFKLIEAETASEGIDALINRRPELMLLDMVLPDSDGVQIIKSVREWSQVPIIIMSARGEDYAKVTALEAGADDYVTKPFSVAELVARIQVALRHAAGRGSGQSEPILEVGDLTINVPAYEVHLGSERIHLTPIEFRLLVALAKHAGRVVTQRQLLNEVWGPEYNEEAQYLRVYVGYLRKKLEAKPGSPKRILTEARVGYRLAV
ncbi:MAG TPA: response regulator [Fimbriimonadaceae bacterium]|nr:response regulator [Fimbriimonadaceae bacterium]